MATSTVSPSPRDRITLPVVAPGRWRFETARRNSVWRMLLSFDAPLITSIDAPFSNKRATAAPPTNHMAKLARSAVAMIRPASSTAVTPVAIT